MSSQDAPKAETQQKEPLRVISLLSASTEIVGRLGMTHVLVGISHECDWPRSILQLPSCSSPNMDPDAPSVQIDTDVREIVKAGRCVYSIDAEKLAKLAPNVILTQDQCRVCAVSEPQLREAVESWAAAVQGACLWKQGSAVIRDSTVRIISLVPHSIADIQNDVLAIADALGVPERGHRVSKQMAAVIEDVRHHSTAARRDLPPPKIALLEWIDPIMGCGHWHPELADAAGGVCVTGDSGGHVSTLTLPQLAATEPDVILFAPCGFDLDRSAKDLREAKWLDSPEWKGLAAVTANRVWVADGLTYFNRSSPRVVASAQIVAEAMWPELSGLWGHRGSTLLTLGEALDGNMLKPSKH